MSYLISILTGTVVLGFVTILQTTIISRIELLNGQLDLVIITLIAWILHEETKHWWLWAAMAGIIMGVASLIPAYLLVLIYLLICAFVIQVKIRIWQAPLMKLFVSVLIASALFLSFSLSYRILMGTSVEILPAINQIMLPTLLLNMVFALPVSYLVQEAASLVYPPQSDL